MITKEEFEKFANKILDLKFNKGRCICGIRINDRNQAEQFWRKITSIGEDWTSLDIKDYCSELYSCNIACQTLSAVWNFLREKNDTDF